VLLDVGANHGAYARLLYKLAPQARIIAFEPHPATFQLLARSLSDIPQIELVNKALGAEAEEVKLYDFLSADGSTQASMSKSAVELYTPDVIEHAVVCTTLDAFMTEHSIDHISFLKIDTEGFDLAVLQGSAHALRDGRISMIQFEFIPANIATGVTMHQFFEVLQDYQISRLCLNGTLRPFARYDVKRCEIYVTHNLIAVRRLNRSTAGHD